MKNLECKVPIAAINFEEADDAILDAIIAPNYFIPSPGEDHKEFFNAQRKSGHFVIADTVRAKKIVMAN